MTIKTLRQRARAGTVQPYSRWEAALADALPWLDDMERTRQTGDNAAPGTVATHTADVLRALGALFQSDAAALSPDACETLAFAAFLHDIGKVATTREEEPGCWGAPGHAMAGGNYLFYRLPDAGLLYPLIRDIIALVRYHHEPERLVREEAREPAYRRLARQANPEWLYWLARANAEASGVPARVETLELFRLFCEEAGVWGNGGPYAEWRGVIEEELAAYPPETRALVLAQGIEAYEAGRIFTPYEAIAISHQYRDDYSELVLTVGPDGAGKAVWVEQHLPDHERLALDSAPVSLRGKRIDQSRNSAAAQRARDELKLLLRAGERVVWQATSLRRLHREKLLAIARGFNARITMVVFHLPLSLLLERNEALEEPLPTDILMAQVNGFQLPELTDAHETIYIDGGAA